MSLKTTPTFEERHTARRAEIILQQRFATVEMLLEQIPGILLDRTDEPPKQREERLAYALLLRDDLDEIMSAIAITGTCADRDRMHAMTAELPALDRQLNALRPAGE